MGLVWIEPFLTKTLRIVNNLFIVLFRARKIYGTLSIMSTRRSGLVIHPISYFLYCFELPFVYDLSSFRNS